MEAVTDVATVEVIVSVLAVVVRMAMVMVGEAVAIITCDVIQRKIHSFVSRSAIRWCPLWVCACS